MEIVSVDNLTPIVALIAGVLILIAPRILNYVVALWLILYGVIELWGDKILPPGI